MRIGQGTNFIEAGFLQWGYKIYNDHTVSDIPGDACWDPIIMDPGSELETTISDDMVP